MVGRQTYGAYSTNLQSDTTFSIKFDHMNCKEYLFATGDLQMWLIATSDSVFNENEGYTNSLRPIKRSSTSSSAYSARWYNRKGVKGDPLIAIGQGSANIIYAEGGSYGANANVMLAAHKGANVFCKQSTANQSKLLTNMHVWWSQLCCQIPYLSIQTVGKTLVVHEHRCHRFPSKWMWCWMNCVTISIPCWDQERETVTFVS